MTRETTIELYKENMKFSCGHFTIFSDTHRERLHGHNYQVYAAIITTIDEAGLSFDYRYYKDLLNKICSELNQYVLLPTKSKYLTIEEEEQYTYVYFANEKIPFLTSDTKSVPITNITVEELSYYFIQRLIENKNQLQQHAICAIEIKVFSAPGQSASSRWENNHD